MADDLPHAGLRLRTRRPSRHRALASCLLLAICASHIAHACEPAGLDWQALYQDHDKNRNRFFEPAEWPMLIRLDSQSVDWRDKAPRRDSDRWQVFRELDRNHDRRLSEEEMNGIHMYFSNPCAGWPWSR